MKKIKRFWVKNKIEEENDDNLSISVMLNQIIHREDVHPMLKTAAIQAIKTGRERELIIMLKTNKLLELYFDNVEDYLIVSIRNFEI